MTPSNNYSPHTTPATRPARCVCNTTCSRLLRRSNAMTIVGRWAHRATWQQQGQQTPSWCQLCRGEVSQFIASEEALGGGGLATVILFHRSSGDHHGFTLCASRRACVVVFTRRASVASEWAEGVAWC